MTTPTLAHLVADMGVLRDVYDKAALQVRKCLATQSGGAKAEAAFATAYQAMVRAGQAPQLRERLR